MMNLFDVYPLFDINIVKGKGCMYGTKTEQNISTFMVVMPLSPSGMLIRTMLK